MVVFCIQFIVLPDDHLIEAIRAGDQSAFAELVDKYKRLAFNVANRILWNPNDAEEAAQDAFVKAYKNLNKFDGRSKFSTWFYRIVSNEALGRARKKRHDQVDISEAIGIGEVDRDNSEKATLVRNSVRKLNDKDSELLTLFYLSELSLEEIGNILDIEPNSAKVSIHRARKKLAAKMLEEIGDEVYELMQE